MIKRIFYSCILLLLISSCKTDKNQKSPPDGITSATETRRPKSNSDWWPNRLNLDLLRKHSELTDPNDPDFDYAKAFNSLDLEAVKEDLRKIITTSQDWWPADYGSYAGLMIRMAWHSAGSYRSADGRGGSRSAQQRFAPQNSWPDNANLDKARRLIWPVKKKYGNKISWGDLMILAGTVALETTGFKTIGFAGGRTDVWEPNEDVYWGSETKWLDNSKRYKDGKLENPLAAVQMGLIYVNPEGPNGNPDPLLAAKDIKETFGRMGMNLEETVALIAGGHTLGKAHGAAKASHLGDDPESASIEEQGLGWKNSYKTGKGPHTITSGLEVVWTPTPAKWSHLFFFNLFENEWKLMKSPAGAHQWVAKNPKIKVPDAYDSDKMMNPTMFTTDLSLRFDPEFEKISRKFYKNPDLFDQAFAKAWFKLTHRDMGPKSSYLGSDIPKEDFIWQDPIPKADYKTISESDIKTLKTKLLNSGLTLQEMITTAWASASTYRNSDRRGGANGARIRLEPQINWEVNNPKQLKKVLSVLEKIKADFDTKNNNKKVSIADLIVLAGTAAVEKAAKNAGYNVEVPFLPGRTDAIQEQTDTASFNLLEPMADGFRNYLKKSYTISTEELLIDKAQLLTLTAPEMTVLLGGLRSLGITYDGSDKGIFTADKNKLTNDFFEKLLDMNIQWEAKNKEKEEFIGKDASTGKVKYTATRADLIFGSNSELRALAEFYASDDSKEKFVKDFISAWTKVMNLDRFDITNKA